MFCYNVLFQRVYIIIGGGGGGGVPVMKMQASSGTVPAAAHPAIPSFHTYVCLLRVPAATCCLS